MITRKFFVTVAAAISLFATPVYAQDADQVSAWLLQNKAWHPCPPETIPVKGGGLLPDGRPIPDSSITNPAAFLIDPAKRTARTSCIVSEPYYVATDAPHDVGFPVIHLPAIEWHLQVVSNLQGSCQLNVNAGKNCTIDVIRACTHSQTFGRSPVQTPCMTPIGGKGCGVCSEAETPI